MPEHRPQIFVVEEEPCVYPALTRHSLLPQAMTIRRFDSAEDMLAVELPHAPSVLVYALRLPGIDGSELLSELRGRGRAMPTIAMVDRGDTDAAHRALAGGADEFMEMPVDADLLLDRVCRAVKRAVRVKPAQAGEQRIGGVLIEHGVLTPEQVDAIIKLQAKRNEPFGDLAEEMFDVAEEDIWRARAQQILPLLPMVNVETDPPQRDALDLITPEEASTYWLLPLRLEKDRLVMATSAGRLAGALIKCDDIFKRLPVKFALSAPRRLRNAIQKHYGIMPLILDQTDLPTDFDTEPDPVTPNRAPRSATDDSVTVRCTWCDEPIEVEPGELGRRVGCPSCGEPTLAAVIKPTAFPTPKPVASKSRPDAPPMSKPGESTGIFRTTPQYGDHSAAELSIRFACEHCGERLKISGVYAGKRVKCPKCGEGTSVPGAAAHPRVVSIKLAMDSDD
ncbi:MAG: response regulator [Phycisphaera sp.]|nr:response regulator [Phycisphaera sp.]